MIKVWDPVVRIFHWGTAIGFLVNYWLIDDGDIHEWIGYGIACLLLMRLAWGLFGSCYARFSEFFPTPSRLKRYIALTLQGKHPEHIGHNPLGGLMILVLMIAIAGVSLTGWMMTLDMFWAESWPEEVHQLLANFVQGLVIIHVVVVLFYDLVLKAGLIRAMITGYKRKTH